MVLSRNNFSQLKFAGITRLSMTIRYIFHISSYLPNIAVYSINYMKYKSVNCSSKNIKPQNVALNINI